MSPQSCPPARPMGTSGKVVTPADTDSPLCQHQCSEARPWPLSQLIGPLELQTFLANRDPASSCQLREAGSLSHSCQEGPCPHVLHHKGQDTRRVHRAGGDILS